MRQTYLAILSGIMGIFVSFDAYAQYYYKDLWNNQQLNKEFNILKNEKIRNVVVKSFEADGQPSEGFFCEKRIDKNYGRVQMMSRSNVTGPSLIISYFNPAGLIIKNVDSTETGYSQTEYEYDENGKISAIKTLTKDDADQAGIAETHRYIYSGGVLTKMVREKNNNPVSTVNFNVDDKGNLVDEEEIINGSKGTKYFYYYDEKNRLTDVVHYNERAKRLLPDYMYEYDELDQIRRQIATEADGSNYFVWRYTYNDKRLRDTERCSTKDRKLLGSVEYVYK